MASINYGWCGTILNIDLSQESITEIETVKYAERFLGGRGIACEVAIFYLIFTRLLYVPLPRGWLI